MQTQHKPVLIFAQNGRFIAQSATQAGYRVWVADCFGDQDLTDIAERYLILPPIDTITAEQLIHFLSQLSHGEDCTLICGSGIENYFPFLEQLPDNIELIGNSSKTINALKTPQLFFTLLQSLNITHPETHLSLPTDAKSYLAKSNSGYGGLHIQLASSITNPISYYFQRFINGQSGSILFLANGKECQLLNINQQTLSPSNQSPFRLSHIEAPWNIPEHHQLELISIINKITLEIGLLGLNSLDFIISDDDNLLVLEINPRISASAELIADNSLFQHHINACLGFLSNATVNSTKQHTALYYIYAPHEYTISPDIIWPNSCRDIPVIGSIIKKESPLCTSVIFADDATEVHRLQRSTKLTILDQF